MRALGPINSNSGWVGAGTAVRLATATEQVAIGTDTPFTGPYRLTVLDDNWLALKAVTGGRTWLFRRETDADMYAGVEMLSIASDINDGLKLYLSSVTGGTRVALWDPTVALVVQPHTGEYPAFAVHGDITVGDILTFSPSGNAWIVGGRTATGLVAATDITHHMCAKNVAGVDTDGGAGIELYPTQSGVVSDGIVELQAYGMGSGALANHIIFSNRSAVDTVTRQWVMNGSGHLVPVADNTKDLGNSAARVRQVYTNVGVSFPATQVASADANTLDDYEEGTWVPTLTFATPGNLSVAYTLREGTYTKIGRQVMVNMTIITSTFTHTTASGALTVTGLTFAANASAMTAYWNAVAWQGVTKANYTQVSSVVSASATSMTFEAAGSGQAVATLAVADVPTGGTVRLTGTLNYIV